MITQEDELIFVWRVSWPMTGEQCYFGVESAANAYARNTGQVERFGIPRRDFKVVPTEVSDAEHRKYVELWDRTQGTPCQQIRWQQNIEPMSRNERMALINSLAGKDGVYLIDAVERRYGIGAVQQDSEPEPLSIQALLDEITLLKTLLREAYPSVLADAELDHDHYESKEMLRDLAKRINDQVAQ